MELKKDLKKLEKNGVTLYLNGKKRIIVDIDIESGINDAIIAIPYSYMFELDLDGNPKIFPDVKNLTIDGCIRIHKIPNSMFPNVTKFLPLHYEAQKTCTNLFYSDETSEIDMSNYLRILPNAFEGCKTTNLINTQNVSCCKKNAFANSAFSKKPFEKGVRMAGTILYDMDYEDDIYLPDVATCISEDIEPEKIKSIHFPTINERDGLYKAFHKIYLFMKAEDVYFDSINPDNYTVSNLLKLKRCKRLHLNEKVSPFKIVDDIVYNKEGSVLVACPNLKEGDITIPEGVKFVISSAFKGCKFIKSVTFPRSFICFEESGYNESPFSDCESLEKINFCSSSHMIGLFSSKSTLVHHCPNLKEVLIPDGINLVGANLLRNNRVIENLILSDDIISVGSYAFSEMTALKELYLPKSLETIGEQSLLGIKNIKCDKYVDGLILNSVYTYGFYDDKKTKINNKLELSELKDILFSHFEIEGKKIYIPHFLNGYTLADIDVLFKREAAVEDIIDYISEQLNSLPKNIVKISNILYYDMYKNENTKAYLKRTAKKTATDLIDYGYEKVLIKFIGFGLISKQSLKSLIDYAANKNMLQIKTILLNEIDKISQNSRRSFSL